MQISELHTLMAVCVYQLNFMYRVVVDVFKMFCTFLETSNL